VRFDIYMSLGSKGLCPSSRDTHTNRQLFAVSCLRLRIEPVAYPGIFSGEGGGRRGDGYARNFFPGGSTNLFEEIGHRERVSVGGSPRVRGSNQFANE
jgi:hypothetical protein